MAEQVTEPNGEIRVSSTEVIKDALRELITTQRRERREAQLNKNRVALGEIPGDSSLSPDFVTTKAKALTKKTLSIQEYHQLQNALIQNMDNVNAFLQVTNAISALVRDMSCNDPDLQISAANCFCNLALGNAKTCTTLAKAASAYLLIILEGCNRPLIEVALWTIGNMVTGCKVAFDILHAQDALKHIISLLKDCDNSILPSVAYASLHYLYAGYHCMKDEEKMELIKAVCDRKFNDTNASFVWLIALLSSMEQTTPYLVNTIPVVIDLLYEAAGNPSHSVIKITAYVRIIGNSVAEPSGKIAYQLLESPKHTSEDLLNLINQLLIHSYTHIRRETLWLIGNLCNHSQYDIRERIVSCLPHLSHLELSVSSLG